jgi:glycosyltransferase involved in cell wall biosynthesis
VTPGRAPRVSVLLPCRDAAAFLDEAVASLLAQTYTDFEILAVDDGSTDATPARLHACSAADARVRVLRGPGSGIAAALRTALSAARGELVARMDADDIAEPTRFEQQVALLDAMPHVAACGTHVRYFPRTIVREGARRYEAWLNRLASPDDLARDIFIECPIAHPTLMVRKETLQRAGGWRDTGWPEDYDLVLRLHAARHALANVPQVLHHWRERPDRLSRTDPRYSIAAFQRCRAHHLAASTLDRRRALIIGAGPVGKSLARALSSEGATIAAFIDLDPRKIGQHIHGVPVLPREALGRFRGAYALAAVGNPRGRAAIRDWLSASGWNEIEQFRAVA